MNDSDHPVNEADFKFRPRNMVTAILSADQVDPCIAALVEAGVDVESVDVLSGPQGAGILDRDGSNHGLRARIARAFQMMGSSENELINYSMALEEGRAVVGVPVDDEERADTVAAILERCGGERALYFRSTAVERM